MANEAADRGSTGARGDRLEAALLEHLGLPSFRGYQREAIEAVMEGRDLLLTMPTGAGKSLVYQLPAVLLEGLILVISPLIALMKDQVDALVERGLRAAFVNSSLGAAERRSRLERARRGELDLLFVTPERFRSPDFDSLVEDAADLRRRTIDPRRKRVIKLEAGGGPG